jgi:hypothetical protein
MIKQGKDWKRLKLLATPHFYVYHHLLLIPLISMKASPVESIFCLICRDLEEGLPLQQLKALDAAKALRAAVLALLTQLRSARVIG